LRADALSKIGRLWERGWGRSFTQPAAPTAHVRQTASTMVCTKATRVMFVTCNPAVASGALLARYDARCSCTRLSSCFARIVHQPLELCSNELHHFNRVLQP
jgi:hypothetical protein